MVRRIAVGNEGVVTRRELLSAGATRAEVNWARGSGRLCDVHPGFGVYSIVPPELLSDDAQLVAALAALDHDAVLGVGTAAHRWQLIAAPPQRLELVSRHGHACPPGVIVHRFPSLRPQDVTHDGHFAITTVARTLLDIAIAFRTEALLRALAEAEFRHALRPQDVLAVLRRGHPGSAHLRRALDLHAPGFGTARSRLERRFRRLLVQHGITLPKRNYGLGDWYVDCLWPDLRLVVELDGGQHDRPRQSAVDAERDLWLRANGYTVLRYAWRQVYEEGPAVVADLRAAMTAAART